LLVLGLITNRKLYTVYELSIGTKIDNLERRNGSCIALFTLNLVNLHSNT